VFAEDPQLRVLALEQEAGEAMLVSACAGVAGKASVVVHAVLVPPPPPDVPPPPLPPDATAAGASAVHGLVSRIGPAPWPIGPLTSADGAVKLAPNGRDRFRPWLAAIRGECRRDTARDGAGL
jgi:hypothetical protein